MWGGEATRALTVQELKSLNTAPDDAFDALDALDEASDALDALGAANRTAHLSSSRMGW